MKTILGTIALAAANCAFAARMADPAAAAKNTGFELGAWRLPKTARLEGDILTVSVPPAASKASNKATAKFHLRPYPGKELHLTMKVRGRNIVRPPMRYHWLGPKFMLMFKDEFSGEMKYPGVSFTCEGGDFDGEFTMIVPLYGIEADYGDLCLGLESASGEMSFDLSTLRISPEGRLNPMSLEMVRNVIKRN